MPSQPAESSSAPSLSPPSERSMQAHGAAGRAKPDYTPANRLDPHFRPKPARAARTSQNWENIREPWMTGPRQSHGYRRRESSWQRTMLWLPWLVALGAAGYGGYALTFPDQEYTLISPLHATHTDPRMPAVPNAKRVDKASDAKADTLRLQEMDPSPDGSAGMTKSAAVVDRPKRLEIDGAPPVPAPGNMDLARKIVIPGAPLTASAALSRDASRNAGPLPAEEATQASMTALSTPPAGREQHTTPASGGTDCSEPLRAMQLCESQPRSTQAYRLP